MSKSSNLLPYCPILSKSYTFFICIKCLELIQIKVTAHINPIDCDSIVGLSLSRKPCDKNEDIAMYYFFGVSNFNLSISKITPLLSNLVNNCIRYITFKIVWNRVILNTRFFFDKVLSVILARFCFCYMNTFHTFTQKKSMFWYVSIPNTHI